MWYVTGHFNAICCCVQVSLVSGRCWKVQWWSDYWHCASSARWSAPVGWWKEVWWAMTLISCLPAVCALEFVSVGLVRWAFPTFVHTILPTGYHWRCSAGVGAISDADLPQWHSDWPDTILGAGRWHCLWRHDVVDAVIRKITTTAVMLFCSLGPVTVWPLQILPGAGNSCLVPLRCAFILYYHLLTFFRPLWKVCLGGWVPGTHWSVDLGVRAFLFRRTVRVLGVVLWCCLLWENSVELETVVPILLLLLHLFFCSAIVAVVVELRFGLTLLHWAVACGAITVLGCCWCCCCAFHFFYWSASDARCCAARYRYYIGAEWSIHLYYYAFVELDYLFYMEVPSGSLCSPFVLCWVNAVLCWCSGVELPCCWAGVWRCLQWVIPHCCCWKSDAGRMVLMPCHCCCSVAVTLRCSLPPVGHWSFGTDEVMLLRWSRWKNCSAVHFVLPLIAVGGDALTRLMPVPAEVATTVIVLPRCSCVLRYRTISGDMPLPLLLWWAGGVLLHTLEAWISNLVPCWQIVGAFLNSGAGYCGSMELLGSAVVLFIHIPLEFGGVLLCQAIDVLYVALYSVGELLVMCPFIPMLIHCSWRRRISGYDCLLGIRAHSVTVILELFLLEVFIVVRHLLFLALVLFLLMGTFIVLTVMEHLLLLMMMMFDVLP